MDTKKISRSRYQTFESKYGGLSRFIFSGDELEVKMSAANFLSVYRKMRSL